MKTALIIRHVPIEGVAGFRAPIEAAGYRLDSVDVTDPGYARVDLDAPDLLVMMGGPMGVYEETRHPWIGGQLRRLERRLAAGLPTLGVCLGAQMIAAALGAHVFAGPVKEVGFHPLAIDGGARNNPLEHLRGLPVLHWHGDTFALPAGAERLASSALYENQAFRIGPNILALQFHGEMGEDPRFDAWVTRWPDTIAKANTSAHALRRDYAWHGPALVAAGQRVIADWLDGVDAAVVAPRTARRA